MAAKYLPMEAGIIAAGQGWTDSSIVMHLAGYIESIGQSAGLTDYLSARAAEEVGDDEDDLLAPIDAQG
jgi:hypothetical protein